MKILILGATGFIGRHLARALSDSGHQVWHGARHAQGPFAIAIDYANPIDNALWREHVRGMDVVINAVGVLNETSAASFAQMHTHAPVALFNACREVGVKRFVQISALGGEASPASSAPAFLASKHAFDAYITARTDSPMHSLIVRPSLVVGIDGDSSQWFRSLASLPLLLLPGRGQQPVQPVQVNDLCHAIKNWIEQAKSGTQILAAVGPKAMSYRAMLEQYRAEMGLPKASALPIPMALMQFASRLMRPLQAILPQGALGMAGQALSPASLQLLEQGSVADPAPFAQLLARPVQRTWFTACAAGTLRHAALASWTMPLMRLSLAAVWLLTALVSAGIYPVADSLALLAPLHLPHTLALTLLFGAALLDATLGLATLFWPSRHLWWLQIALIVGYTVIISLTLPAFWLHPFGPILKNLPILAMLTTLLSQETQA